MKPIIPLTRHERDRRLTESLRRQYTEAERRGRIANICRESERRMREFDNHERTIDGAWDWALGHIDPDDLDPEPHGEDSERI